MILTGSHVVWVVGARFPTEAEAGVDSPIAHFVRDIGDEHLILMSPTRFDDQMIRTYLTSKVDARNYTHTQIDLIAQFTRGLPLAISMVATLLGQGQLVEDICQEMSSGRPSDIISRLARRYLVHAEHQNYPEGDSRRDDLIEILGLALAFSDLRSDPELLAALWNVTDPLNAFQDLARRHDFVLQVSRRLHDDVRDTLRIDLLDPYRRVRARAINERALVLLTSRLKLMRTRWPGLDQQLSHKTFITTLLGVLWHTLWFDNQAGLDLLIEVLPILTAADPSTAVAAAAMMDQFANTMNEDQQRELSLVTQISSSLGTKPALPQTATSLSGRTVRLTLSGLSLEPKGLSDTEPLIGEAGDRQVAVMILRAWLQRNDDVGKAITALQSAADRTSSARLRLAIGTEALTITNRLIWADPGNTSVPMSTGLAAAKVAVETLIDHSSAWFEYGVALNRLGRFEESLVAYDRALALDPSNASAHYNRGMTLDELGRFEDALAAIDQALKLGLNDADTHNGRGKALLDLGRFADALAVFDQAVALDPSNASAHNNRGVALCDLGRFQDGLVAFDQAFTLNPSNANYPSGRSWALLNLGRVEDALAACDQALALNPNNFSALLNKGIALTEIADFDNALTMFNIVGRAAPTKAGEARAWAGAILWHRHNQAGARDQFALVQGRVSECTPFITMELEAIALCGLGKADDAEHRLRAALPLRAPGDKAQLRTIYNLLAEPPLAGIDRICAIIEHEK